MCKHKHVLSQDRSSGSTDTGWGVTWADVQVSRHTECSLLQGNSGGQPASQPGLVSKTCSKRGPVPARGQLAHVSPALPCMHGQHTHGSAPEAGLGALPPPHRLHLHLFPVEENLDVSRVKAPDITIRPSASTPALTLCTRGYVPEKGPISSKVTQGFHGKTSTLVRIRFGYVV